VIDGKLIVTGGWALQTEAHTKFADTLAVLDLNTRSPAWKTVPQPFKRRALIATTYHGKMYVMGGMDEKNKIVHDVDIYDPATGRWTKGPDLPGDEIDGFAPAACLDGGKLYVSVADGSLYRLNDTAQTWEKAGSATARVAHRIVSDGNKILVIGGAEKGRNLDLIEPVNVATN
jgi:N-acetylneuraminic acid mutarotase